MTGALAAWVLSDLLFGLGAWALWPVFFPKLPVVRDGLAGSQSGSRDPARAPDTAGTPWPAPGWLPVTRSAPAPLVPPRAPRISADRVTLTERIRATYEAADRPVSGLLASYGWPAQEVTT
jgi:hypothetical protein